MAARIDVEVSDQLGFLQDFAPRGTYLETEETFTVVANFLVNMSAEVNSESLVTVTLVTMINMESLMTMAVTTMMTISTIFR